MDLRIGRYMAGPVIILLTVCLCACSSDFGIEDEREGVRPTFYSMEITVDGGSATYKLSPPPFSGDSYFDTRAVTLVSVNDKAPLEVVSVNVVGNEIRVTLRVTNDGDDVLERVWLIAQSQTDGVKVISDSADGFIGDANYYFLQNLGIGETSGDITVELDNSLGASEILVRFDVVSVKDRIVFQYFNPSGTSEIWSSTTDGSETTPVVKPDDYASSPTTSPDGGWIAFAWGYPTEADIGLARADGGGAVKLTCFPEGYLHPGGFTKDGKKIYVRYKNPAVGTADVYLLDISTALADCSSDASLEPVSSLGDGASETLPESFPDGKYVLYQRRVHEDYPPPYSVSGGEPNPYPGSCENWVSGSESGYDKFNLYLKPTDPMTGLTDGPEIFFWEHTLAQGSVSVAPDSRGVILKAGGCLRYRYDCRCGYTHSPDAYLTCDGTTFHNYQVSTLYASDPESALSPPSSLVSCGSGYSTRPNDPPSGPGGPAVSATFVNINLSWPAESSPPSTVTGYNIYMDGNYIDTVPGCQWKVVCDNNCNLPMKLFRLEIPEDPSSVPLPYAYFTYSETQNRCSIEGFPDKFKFYNGFAHPGESEKASDNPFWCDGTDRVVYTDYYHDIFDTRCSWTSAPGTCEDHRLLVNIPGAKADAQCTQAVHAP